MHSIRIALAQINSTVGDIGRNAEKVLTYVEKAKAKGAELVVFPELVLTGYPPEDLLLKPAFIDENQGTLKKISKKIKGITAVIGFVDRDDSIYNAAAVVSGGRINCVYRKMLLPNYGVFDEQRYFTPGAEPINFMLGDVKIGIGICEDIWFPYGPAKAQCRSGAEIIVNLNASPFNYGKSALREKMLIERARENKVPVVYVNNVGGQDELVFDGHSLVVNENGEVTTRGEPFTEELLITELELSNVRSLRKRKKISDKVKCYKAGALLKKKKPFKEILPSQPIEQIEEVLRALLLGTSDYVRKNGFKRCIVALSGGVDSALVVAIAAEAVGAENVDTVFMPTVYSSKASEEDSKLLAKNLGVEFSNISIQPLFEEYLKTLKASFKGEAPDATEENLQARIRGNMIMAISNKFGHLVLTTGNKSEMSVGYATLYGDMAGGFAVIKDVPKTMVYELCRYINKRAGKEVIPERIITKAPSAELKENQFDQDTLPPYDVLDPILKAYVEDDKSIEDITRMGFKGRVVKKIVGMVDSSEYKRRQAPPGIKITT
ncbi:MAG: NAD+ synthase, partial [Deltaproteobacteria bacterium]|nr:NAD+ synthase [Deltaproteobacteria bacterium]